MNHFQHRLVIGAPAASVFAAITSIDGLRGWWTQDCDGSTRIGGTIHFRFGPSHADMRVEGLDANREVRWLCTGEYIAADQLSRKDEWVGTHVVFRLTAESATRTRLDFEHVGLVPAFECYDLCRNGWQYYLGSLQQLLETGHGMPIEHGQGGRTCNGRAQAAA